jgi:hypothetical protein
MMASLGAACFGSVEHALGVAALTMGRMDQAIEHFRGAVRDNLALGHFPAVVLSRSRLAEAYTRRGGPHDREDARAELATATHEATTSAMPVPERAGAEPAGLVECRRAGRHWEVRLDRHRATVGHSVGMRHLATLIAHPGREIPATELMSGLGAPADRAALSAQPVLDDVARREYRRRLSSLSAEIDELDAADDRERATRTRAERDWLLSELATATGLGGRDRRFADNDERARIAVGKAIRRAISRVTEADPVLGEALRMSVTTGLRCSYAPC